MVVKVPQGAAARHLRWTPLAALVLALAACGGGGGATGATASTPVAAAASLTGKAIDSPIAGAQVVFTSGAPQGDAGATVIGTVTAGADGSFTGSVTLPATSAPVFANATDPNQTSLVLSSYLGTATSLAAAGTLSSTELPDLDVTPVTTAALAVYAQVNGGAYANLTHAAYGTTLHTYRGDILVIASAIKAVGDKLCTPSASITSTTNLAAAIAAASNLTSGNSTTLASAAAALGGNCATALTTLQQAIASDDVFGPQLSTGDVVESGTSVVPAGAYQLQALVAETGLGANLTASNVAAAPTSTAAPSVFADTTLTVASDGTISSTDGNVTGVVRGALVKLTIKSGVQTYQLRGKLGAVPSALVTGGSAFALQGGGLNAGTNVLTNFSAVLAASGAAPVWNGVTVPASSSESAGVSCAAGQPIRLSGFVPGVGGGVLGECVVPSASGWTMSSPASVKGEFDFEFATSNTPTGTPTLTATTWTPASPASFILTDAAASFALNVGSAAPVSGTGYYVMGSRSIVFATATVNGVFMASESALMKADDSSDSPDH
ncbi:hypothetical protein C0Z18_02340 [Trinickia dabaoshanensis]|uniref:Uncharacterized protein n=1 Tax=Trinickia dabaoshanensis TaxID=564714 RepID=A0A2N7W0Y1_9BURK|nr:hypothetical protein C0Z18_02340 [Trinickia dabaoshanensis]